MLRQRLDAWTEEYEGEEAKRREAAAAALAEDGWTVVKRRGVCSCAGRWVHATMHFSTDALPALCTAAVW